MKKFVNVQNCGGNYSDVILRTVKALDSTNASRIVIIVPISSIIEFVSDTLVNAGYQKDGMRFSHDALNHSVIINGVTNYNNFDTDAVIYYLLDSKQIFTLEDFKQFAEEVSIVVNNNDLLWHKTWGVTSLFDDNHIEMINPTSVQRNAMDQLSNAINHTSYSFHPSDEEFAKKVLITLRNHDSVDPDVLFAYVKREKNWPFELCSVLKNLAQNIAMGQTPRFSNFTNQDMQELYNNWI